MLDVSCKVALVPFHPKEFKPNLSLQIHPLPFTVSTTAFWLASWLLLTIPYRVYFERFTGKLKLVFTKTATGVRASTTQSP